MLNVKHYTAATRAALAQQLADQIAQELAQAIAARGRASLVVSGGSTPLPFFQALKAQALDWEQVTVTLADERFVDPDHVDSNEKLVRTHLLRPEMHFIPLLQSFSAAENLEQAAQRADAALRAIPLPFDAVILGMGEDAHTASLFPHHPQLESALDIKHTHLCLPINHAPKPPPQRLTLTFPALIQARHIHLHITGAAKKPVVERALATHDPATMPISAFLHQQQAPVAIWWAE